MLYETTSSDIRAEFYPFQDVFVSTSREEINVNEILYKWSSSFRGKHIKEPFFAIPSLLPILQIDYSSAIYQFLEFKSETALTEEFFRTEKQIKVLEKISRIYDKLILEEELFKEVDKIKLIRTITKLLKKISPEQLNIPEEELSERIRGVLAIETVSGMLNELTPEQIKDFDEAVKRRPLFK